MKVIIDVRESFLLVDRDTRIFNDFPIALKKYLSPLKNKRHFFFPKKNNMNLTVSF